MRQGYEPEDISPSDKALLLPVLGQVLPHHQGCDITRRPTLTLSWLKHYVQYKSIHNQKNEGDEKSNQRKSLSLFFFLFFFIRTILFYKDSLSKRTAHAAIASWKRYLLLFCSEWFTEISFWLRNNGWERELWREGGREGCRHGGSFSSGRWFKLTTHARTSAQVRYHSMYCR